MLYLSLLTLPRSAGRWRFVRSYELHQLIWQGFSTVEKGVPGTKPLYRHDERDDIHSILVQSFSSPDWSFLEDEAEGTTSRVREFDPLKIEPDARFRFLVRANAVVSRRGYDGPGRKEGYPKHRLIPVGSDRKRMAARAGVELDDYPTRDEQLNAWLVRQGGLGGFTTEISIPGPNHDVLVRRSSKERPMTFTGVDFEGVLRVTDPAVFAGTLRNGIGRGRAFGFGMLSIMR